MGAQVADRRPQVAKPCHIGPLSIWPIVRGGPPVGLPLRWPRSGHFLSLSQSSGIRRGRPKGVPLRAEGFPKRRCHFESDAAQRHLNPR